MKFRIAKISDAKEIAEIHMICANHQKDGFMHKLGISFLIQYYKIFINEKNSIIVVAENEELICGFHSGTVVEEEHQRIIRTNKIRLGLTVLPKLLINPKMTIDVYRRYKSLSALKSQYRVSHGPRGEYWAWLPSMKNPAASMMLRKIWANVMRDLGCKSFKFEVDLLNSDVDKYAKAFSCDVLEVNSLPDGRKRAIMEQVFKIKK